MFPIRLFQPKSCAPKTATLSALIGLALALAGTATAATVKMDGNKPAVIQAVSDCRKITADAARLACYDTAAAGLDDQIAKGTITAFDREQVKTVRRQAFGFQIPALTLFTKGPKEDAVETITLKLSDARQDAGGKWVMTAADGPVWQQIDTSQVYSEPHVGSEVVVSHGMIGSFFCKVDGHDRFRCARVR